MNVEALTDVIDALFRANNRPEGAKIRRIILASPLIPADPGASDLDLIIVLNHGSGSLTTRDIRQFSVPLTRLSLRTRTIFEHLPIMTDENLFLALLRVDLYFRERVLNATTTIFGSPEYPPKMPTEPSRIEVETFAPIVCSNFLLKATSLLVAPSTNEPIRRTKLLLRAGRYSLATLSMLQSRLRGRVPTGLSQILDSFPKEIPAFKLAHRYGNMRLQWWRFVDRPEEITRVVEEFMCHIERPFMNMFEALPTEPIGSNGPIANVFQKLAERIRRLIPCSVIYLPVGEILLVIVVVDSVSLANLQFAKAAVATLLRVEGVGGRGRLYFVGTRSMFLALTASDPILQTILADGQVTAFCGEPLNTPNFPFTSQWFKRTTAYRLTSDLAGLMNTLAKSRYGKVQQGSGITAQAARVSLEMNFLERLRLVNFSNGFQYDSGSPEAVFASQHEPSSGRAWRQASLVFDRAANALGANENRLGELWKDE